MPAIRRQSRRSYWFVASDWVFCAASAYARASCFAPSGDLLCQTTQSRQRSCPCHPAFRFAKSTLGSSEFKGPPRRAIPGQSRLARHPCRSPPETPITFGLLKGAFRRVRLYRWKTCKSQSQCSGVEEFCRMGGACDTHAAPRTAIDGYRCAPRHPTFVLRRGFGVDGNSNRGQGPLLRKLVSRRGDGSRESSLLRRANAPLRFWLWLWL